MLRWLEQFVAFTFAAFFAIVAFVGSIVAFISFIEWRPLFDPLFSAIAFRFYVAVSVAAGLILGTICNVAEREGE